MITSVFEMIWRLLNRWEVKERSIAESMSRAFAQKTGLPAFAYKGPNALKIGDVEGVWARNLLANRIYEAPVIFWSHTSQTQKRYTRGFNREISMVRKRLVIR